jgi:hypothetical protein
MLFKEITAVYTENHTKHKKIQTYRLSSRWDGYLPQGFKGLTFLEHNIVSVIVVFGVLTNETKRLVNYITNTKLCYFHGLEIELLP